MRKFLLLLVVVCQTAFAQTFPVNNLTVSGTSSFGGQATFTLSPIGPTPGAGDSSTKFATTAFVGAAVLGLPYAPLASPGFSGVPTAPTATSGTNTNQIATTAFVTTALSGVSGFAPINSPTFTGTVTIPSGASISGYLTTAAAASTYAALTGANFTGNVQITTTGSDNVSLKITNTGALGANLAFTGSGSTTPNKTIAVVNGVLQVFNSAYNSAIFTLTDAGDLTIPNLDGATIGAHTPESGTFTTLINGNQSWLLPLIPATTNIAQGDSISYSGGIGMLGASRTSDSSVSGSQGTQGGSFYGINNNSTTQMTSYAVYAESRRYSGASTTQGIESDILNLDTVVNADPYAMESAGITPNLWLSSGRTDVTSGAVNATMAIGVVNNETGYENGLMVQNGALDTASGEGKAIVLPANYGIDWYGSSGNIDARVRSDATSPSLGMVFSNNGVSFQGASSLVNVLSITTLGSELFQVAPTTSWQHDASGATTAIGNGGNVPMPAGNGLLVVEDSINSHEAMYMCNSGSCALVFANGGVWVASTTTPAAGHMSMAWSGSSYNIYNNEGATETVTVASIRMKASN